MTIASEIARLDGVKTDILGAIAEKKVDVPTGAMLADAPDLIRSIKNGINVKIGQGVYPAVKIGNQLWLAKNLDEELGTLGQNDKEATFTTGYYNTEGWVVGSTFDFSRLVTTGEGVSYKHTFFDVKKGDVVTCTCVGGGAAKPWAVLDKDDKILRIGVGGNRYTDFVLTATEDGKIVVQGYGAISAVWSNKETANEWYYNNDEATYKKNGRLYTWNNVNENIGKLGLTKWRWPTRADIDALVAIDPTGKMFRNKSFGNGTDDFGFNAIESGSIANGTFSPRSFFIWSQNQNRMRIDLSSCSIASTILTAGLSLRLVMDLNEDGTIPDSNIVLEDVPATTAEPLALANEPIVEEAE